MSKETSSVANLRKLPRRVFTSLLATTAISTLGVITGTESSVLAQHPYRDELQATLVSPFWRQLLWAYRYHQCGFYHRID